LEADIDWEKWNLSLNATWMEAINRTPESGTSRFSGKWLPNRPKWAGAARVTRKFSRGSAFAEYRHKGANFADRAENVLFDSRGVINIGSKYDISPTTDAPHRGR
jgi:hypothetical protein